MARRRFQAIRIERIDPPRRRTWWSLSIRWTDELCALLTLVALLALCWLLVQLRMGGL